MAHTQLITDMAAVNPIDLIEDIISANDWPYERQSPMELSVSVAGNWCDYHLGFTFSEEQGSIQLASAYDIHVPARKRDLICRLLTMMNERMWIGHFDLWSEDDTPMFRHAMLVREDYVPTPSLLRELIEFALTECERYYPAFQFVLWGGKSPEDAIRAAMLETVGEA